MKATVKKTIWMAAGLVLLVSACGYRLEGGGLLHPGVARVGVAVFENRSAQTYAGVFFTNEMIREIQDRTDTQVVDPDRAVFHIRGAVQGITFSALSRTSAETVVERRVTAVVDLQLLDADNAVRWSVSNFRATESYFVAPDKVDDEANIREAVGLIAQRTAERMVSLMSADF